MKSFFKQMRFRPLNGLLLLACCLICSATTQAQQAPKPVFTLDFSKGSTATGAKGQKIPARVQGELILRDTIHGKAMVSGPKAAYLHFPVSKVVNPDAGTIAMWVCPLDWEGTEQKFHTFFNTGGQGSLLLYKYYLYGLQMMSLPMGEATNYPAAVDITQWKPSQWHFIVGTWSSSRIALYVDGVLVAENEPPTKLKITPQSLAGEFEIGDNPGETIPRTSQSLIADVRIYDRALSAEHIAAHYTGDFSKVVPLSSKSLSLSLLHNADTHLLEVKLKFKGADINVNQAEIEFSLQRDGKIVQTISNQKFIEENAQDHFDSSQLAAGNYQIVAKVTSGDQQAEIKRDWIVPDLSWMGNKLGLEDKVLLPWTALKVTRLSPSGFDIDCWGRTYQFRHAPLPTQIISQNQAMLARPVTLGVLADGQALVWKNSQVTLTQSSATHAIVTGTAEAQTSKGKVVLQTTMRLEYDGLVILNFQLQKPQGWQPQKMSLEVPLRADLALYYHRADIKQWNSPAGQVPTEQGIVDHTKYQPFSWLGDDSRGLFWFCERADFWPNWSNENALQTVREKDVVSILVNLLDGQPLPDNWNFQCGLQATPVKPIPTHWRAKRLAPAPRANIQILWPTPDKNSQKYFGYPEATEPAAFAARVKGFQGTGQSVVPYSCLAYASSAAPEYRWFAEQWDLGLYDSGSADVALYNASFDAISPRQKSVQDFFVWKNMQFMKQYNLDGFYHDQSIAVGSTNANAGYGWQDGNIRQPTYGILAMRGYYRRFHSAMKQQNPDAFSIAHMSGQLNIPFLAYEDAILNGEQFRHIVKDSYMDLTTMAQWRAVFTGRQWGAVSYFLPGFTNEFVAQIAPTRGLAALTLLHDVPVWPNVTTSNMQVWNEMYDALDKFGYEQSTFIPYWSTKSPATTTMPDVYISAYKRADGRALIVVGNTSREARSGTITLDAQALGVPMDKILEWPSEKVLQSQNGKVSVALDGLDYRLLVVGEKIVARRQ